MAPPPKKNGGRQPLAKHLERERIVHDLTEAEKHCPTCQVKRDFPSLKLKVRSVETTTQLATRMRNFSAFARRIRADGHHAGILYRALHLGVVPHDPIPSIRARRRR